MLRDKILIVDDDKLVTWSLINDLKSENCEVSNVMTGREALIAFRKNMPDIVLLDLKLPDISGMEVLKQLKDEAPDAIIIMMTAYASVQTAVEAVRLGALDFIKKPFTFDELRVVIDRALKSKNLSREVAEMRRELQQKHGISNIIGVSNCMQNVFTLTLKIARSDATTVLILGESGTGKDLVAKAIHYEGKRSQYPFMAINCGSLPDTLLESELFGYEKGAFTDAKTSKKGLFELANHGTLLLDEIGDASPSFQVKLLRFLEEKSFKHIGGNKDIEVDIRIIAATNQNLEKRVKEGKFRQDLFYRINVVPIKLSPLREREEDVPLLSNHFVDLFNKEFKKHVKSIAPEALAILKNYHWPGNVRELKNVLERAMILENMNIILKEHLPLELIQQRDTATTLIDFQLPVEGTSLEGIEKELIGKALAQTQGNQSQAAKLLQISRHTLRYKMKKHHISNETLLK